MGGLGSLEDPMSRKHLPALEDFVGLHAPDSQAAPRLRRARAELRVVKAVVRAAKLVRKCHEEFWSHSGRAERAMRANNRALADLDKLGKESK
jgi:hypothetical protein